MQSTRLGDLHRDRSIGVSSTPGHEPLGGEGFRKQHHHEAADNPSVFEVFGEARNIVEREKCLIVCALG